MKSCSVLRFTKMIIIRKWLRCGDKQSTALAVEGKQSLPSLGN